MDLYPLYPEQIKIHINVNYCDDKVMTTVSDDTKEKLRCILELVPPSTWTNKEAGQFRWNYLIQTGKRVPSNVPSYPFSGFLDGSDYVFFNPKGADDTLPLYDRENVTLDAYISSLTSSGNLDDDISRILHLSFPTHVFIENINHTIYQMQRSKNILRLVN